MRNNNQDLSVNVVENGVTVDCIPYDQAIMGRQYVFTNADAFASFMKEWYGLCNISERPVITGKPLKE